MSLFVGYEVGTAKVVKVPCFHMLVTGQTRLSGKTTLLKALARQAVQRGYKVLILDSKSNVQDYEGFGQQVPICLQESTDSLILISLLESIFRRKITAYYATLTRVSEDAKTFEDVIANAEKLKEKSRQGFIRDACVALIDLLKRLMLQTKKVETTPTLQLPYPINRMTINNFEVQGQQLIAKAVFDEALRKYKKLIIILDEAYKFIPQKYSSACAKSIQDFVTQSGATESYLWMATQFLAPTSKDAMKTMAVKLLGTQDHDTECQHTLDLIPDIKKLKLTKDSIMHLHLGHFVTVTKKWVKTVYAVPEYADKNECAEVALKLRDPQDIHYLVPISAQDYAKIPKTSLPEIEIKKPVEIKIKKPVELEIPVELPKEKKPKGKKVKKIAKKPSFSPTPSRISGRIELIENNLEALRLKLKNIEKIVLSTPKVGLRSTKTIVDVSSIIKEVVINDQTMQGKILAIAEKGFLNTWKRLGDIVKAIIEEGWTARGSQVNNALNELVKRQLIAKKYTNRNYYRLAKNVTFKRA